MWVLPVVSLSPIQAWEDDILDAARLYMNAEVCFYEESGVTESYDPITGTGGGTGITVIWRGKARVQHLAQPSQFETAYNTSANHMFRFQLDPADNPPEVYFGLKARVLDGGRDQSLTQYAMVVNSAVNSSHMAVRTIELEATMEPADWEWDPDLFVIPSATLFPSSTLYPSGVN